MVPGSFIPCTMRFILIQIFVLSVVKSELSATHDNTTDYASFWKSGRSRRCLSDRMPWELKIRIEYEPGVVIDLKWVLKTPNLANEHLPVITSIANFNPNVMSDVGEFVVYHDETECSTVTYFEKDNSLYGVIGTSHYIESLPFYFNGNGEYLGGVVGEPYVKKHEQLPVHVNPDEVLPPLSDTDAWEYFFRPPIQRPSSERQSDYESGPSSKRQRPEQNSNRGINMDGTNVHENKDTDATIPRDHPSNRIYFSETLLFVTRDIVDMFKVLYGEDRYFECIVRYYIIYFNVVNMFFRKLVTRDVNLNIIIAKIVVDDNSKPFEFIGNDELQFTTIVNGVTKYLKSHRLDFMPDSFDHVFIHTRRAVMDDFVLVNGLSRHGKDLYEARKNNQFFEVVPITVVTARPHLVDYTVAVQEIGRVLTMKIDPREKGRVLFTTQCYGLMQRDGGKCLNCLRWSDESKERFIIFFRENRNRCFLMNKPRSLLPPGVHRLVTPDRQCRCFEHDSKSTRCNGHQIKKIGSHACGRLLTCRNGGQMKPTVLPFDGTPCTDTKACWDGKCSPLLTEK